MNSKITYLARSGYKGALWLGGLLLLFLFFGFSNLAFLFAIALAFWIFMFRNPERVALHLSENAFLSPIDGEIKQIQSKENITTITINSSVLDVGVIRSPMDIADYKIDALYGIPLYFSKTKEFFASKISFSFARGKMTFCPSLFHIYPLNPKTQNLERGERMGFMKAGEVVIEIKDIEVKVNVGDKLKGGESVLGYLQ